MSGVHGVPSSEGLTRDGGAIPGVVPADVDRRAENDQSRRRRNARLRLDDQEVPAAARDQKRKDDEDTEAAKASQPASGTSALLGGRHGCVTGSNRTRRRLNGHRRPASSFGPSKHTPLTAQDL